MPDDVSKVIGIDFKVTNKDGLEAIKKFKSSLQGLKTIVTNTVKKIDTIETGINRNLNLFKYYTISYDSEVELDLIR